MQNHEFQSKESLPNNNKFNPRALEMLATMTNIPKSDESKLNKPERDKFAPLTLDIMEIGDEQCVVARVVDLTPEMKAVFDGASQVADAEAQAGWHSWRRDMEYLGGVSDTEIQAVLTGKTGRQKEIQIAFFGLKSGEDLMSAMRELNKLRKNDGVIAHEGVPESLAYLPENLLKATKNIREESADELTNLSRVFNAAVTAGVLAVPNFRR